MVRAVQTKKVKVTTIEHGASTSTSRGVYSPSS